VKLAVEMVVIAAQAFHRIIDAAIFARDCLSISAWMVRVVSEQVAMASKRVPMANVQVDPRTDPGYKHVKVQFAIVPTFVEREPRNLVPFICLDTVNPIFEQAARSLHLNP